MVQALTLAEEFDYTLKSERDQNGTATVFRLKRLSVADEAWITDISIENAGRVPMGAAAARLLRRYLVGVQNFKTRGGEDFVLEFERDPSTGKDWLTERSWLAIPRDARVELTLAVIRAGNIEEEQVEKSEPESTSPTAK